MFQDFRLLDDRTVYEKYCLCDEGCRCDTAEIRRQVPLAFEHGRPVAQGAALPNAAFRAVRHSALRLRDALANNPPILLADEPTVSLPPKTAIEIVELLDEINMRGTTVVMSTHAKDIVDRMQKAGHRD